MLKSQNFKTISPENAADLVATGKWVLVDVRTEEAHQAAHPEGAVNVPLYQPISFSKGFNFKSVMKTIAYKSNGVNPVEPNPDFLEQLQQATGSKGAIVMCEAGGTLKGSVNFPEGKPSRSLQAAYRSLAGGVHSIDKIQHLERGVFGWYQADLPMVGDYSPDVGRTPMAAAEPTLQLLNQERGYEMNEKDKKIEEQKKKFFGLF